MSKIKKVYAIEKIASTVTIISLDSLDVFLGSLIGEFEIICWQHQGVYRGRVSNNKIYWIEKPASFRPPSNKSKYWQRARIFNKKEEYQIVVRSGRVVGRHRLDGSGEITEVINSQAVIRPIIVSPENQNTNENSLQGIQVINYLDYDKVGKVKVADMRFVNFKNI